jgi:transposase InsO family protein
VLGGLAVVQDVFSRRIIGWSMRDDPKAGLFLDALGMAITSRGGRAAGVVAHSDHGSHRSLVYNPYAKKSEMRPRFGRRWPRTVCRSRSGSWDPRRSLRGSALLTFV